MSGPREVRQGDLDVAVWSTRPALAVTLSNMVLLSGGTTPGLGARITKLPMPIQKAMARPENSPNTAP